MISCNCSTHSTHLQLSASRKDGQTFELVRNKIFISRDCRKNQFLTVRRRQIDTWKSVTKSLRNSRPSTSSCLALKEESETSSSGWQDLEATFFSCTSVYGTFLCVFNFCCHFSTGDWRGLAVLISKMNKFVRTKIVCGNDFLNQIVEAMS